MRSKNGFKVTPSRQAKKVAEDLTVGIVNGEYTDVSAPLITIDYRLTRKGKSVLFQAFMGTLAIFPFYEQKIRAPWGLRAIENASQRAIITALERIYGKR